MAYTPEQLKRKREGARRYRQANPDRDRARQRRWRENNRDKIAAKNREYRKRHPDVNMKYKYDLDMDGYNALLEKQGGVCAICRRPGKLVVDHDHETGKVRGLLHHNCNKAIGMFEDNPEFLEGAAAYLRVQ
jgi:hypothetical protein